MENAYPAGVKRFFEDAEISPMVVLFIAPVFDK
jgi:hypothetical protein